MTILTPAEGIRLTSYCITESRVMSDYPITEQEKQASEVHRKREDKLCALDSNYKRKPWYRPGNEPVERTQKEIEERSNAFIKQMISERPKDFDLMKEVDSFDPLENFKKKCEALKKLPTEKENYVS